jgi:hypothetical protein
VGAKGMKKSTSNNKIPEEYKIESDKNLRDSGVQGGKIIAEHLALGCFIFGIPFVIIGLWSLISMFFGLGYPTNTAIIIGALLVTVIGLLLTVAGYSIRRAKHMKN